MVSSIFGCKALALQSSSRAPLGGIRQEAVKNMFAACNAHEFLATIPFLTALVCSTVFDDKCEKSSTIRKVAHRSALMRSAPELDLQLSP